MSVKSPLCEQVRYRMCAHCVMDTTHSEITFDSEGICNFCYDYKQSAGLLLLPPELASSRLQEIITQIKASGNGRDYDCLLGVSGGVDSTYLAYLLKQFGVRVLAVQFDNGWNSELAVKNIEMMCRRLDMDLFTYVVDWAEFRDLQLSFLMASVANVEAPTDHGIFATLYRVAEEHGIRYILNGNNIVTEQISVPSYGYTYKDLYHIRAVHRRFGTVRLKTFPRMGFFKELYYRRIRRIRSVSLLNYVQYKKDEAIKVLEQELNWRYYGGKHFESVITRFHQSYILPRKFGVDKRRAHLSNLIFSGQITRDEALVELQRDPCPREMLSADREYVIKKLRLSESQFERIISERPRSYREYPNAEWLYKSYNRLCVQWIKLHQKKGISDRTPATQRPGPTARPTLLSQ